MQKQRAIMKIYVAIFTPTNKAFTSDSLTKKFVVYSASLFHIFNDEIGLPYFEERAKSSILQDSRRQT